MSRQEVNPAPVGVQAQEVGGAVGHAGGQHGAVHGGP